MTDNDKPPNVYGVPPGAGFVNSLAKGLRERLAGEPPESAAKTEILVNLQQVRTNIKKALAESSPGLHPKIRLVEELASDPELASPQKADSEIRQTLELARLVRKLVEKEPGLAPEFALFELAQSLSKLLNEMAEEGVDGESLESVDASGHSSHWERSLKFIGIIKAYAQATGYTPERERVRAAAQSLMRKWEEQPPQAPVIMAGSTGSQRITLDLMKAVARLPTGAVVLPGFDFDLPEHAWSALDGEDAWEEHPQYRFRKLLRELEMPPESVRPWTGERGESTLRGKLISLALRPPPVTGQWIDEGPALGDAREAAREMTLVEADGLRAEAEAISLIALKAVEDEKRVTIVTQDTVTARRVKAILEKWGVQPIDSIGALLQSTPPFRFLRLIADIAARGLEGESLLALAKNPLFCSGKASRPKARRWIESLEIRRIRKLQPENPLESLAQWSLECQGEDPEMGAWALWLHETLSEAQGSSGNAKTASEHAKALKSTAEKLSAGPGQRAKGRIWSGREGAHALRAINDLISEGDVDMELDAWEFRNLLASVRGKIGENALSKGQRHDVTITGTFHPVSEKTGRAILCGLNEGSWPKRPGLDPWMSRQMRKDAGLPLPEREIGLSALDFQTAVNAPEVFLTRSTRDAESPLVPSRWLNRLTHLLAGLGEGGEAALGDMRARGRKWTSLARRVQKPKEAVSPEKRPSPVPPPGAAPNTLSITQIKTLITNPYEIYARKVLGLRPMNPARRKPGPLEKGNAIHEIFEAFLRDTMGGMPEDAESALAECMEQTLDERVPWPAARILWRAGILRLAPWFVQAEKARREEGSPLGLESEAEMGLGDTGFTLTGRADRIDRLNDGTLAIYDYKTGKAPTKGDIHDSDRQMPIEAAIAQKGGFRGVAAAKVSTLSYIELRQDGREVIVPMDGRLVEETWRGLQDLLGKYLRGDSGFTAKPRPKSYEHPSEYDQLARYGEWSKTDAPVRERLSHGGE